MFKYLSFFVSYMCSVYWELSSRRTLEWVVRLLDLSCRIVIYLRATSANCGTKHALRLISACLPPAVHGLHCACRQLEKALHLWNLILFFFLPFIVYHSCFNERINVIPAALHSPGHWSLIFVLLLSVINGGLFCVAGGLHSSNHCKTTYFHSQLSLLQASFRIWFAY